MIVTYSIGDISDNKLHSSHVPSVTFVIVTYSIGDICGNELHLSRGLTGTFVETHCICHVFYHGHLRLSHIPSGTFVATSCTHHTFYIRDPHGSIAQLFLIFSRVVFDAFRGCIFLCSLVHFLGNVEWVFSAHSVVTMESKRL